MTGQINVAVIGAGYWGRNYVRNFELMPEAQLSWVCDLDEGARARARSTAPSARLTADCDDVFSDPEVQAVVVATNVATHHALVMAALQAGKHVLVEKPMAASLEQAEQMNASARQRERTLMVGHLLLYHPAVERLRELILEQVLGRVYYLYALRVNLGRVRADENALWSFGPHDLSMISFLLGQLPCTVAARGRGYLRSEVEDVVFLNLEYPDQTMAQIQLSWLDPHKERRLTVVGSKKMVVFDDTHASEKLRIYDKGVEAPPEYASYGAYLALRNGDIHIPRVALTEPLATECRHFVRCVRERIAPRSPGEAGAAVVRILDAASLSLRQRGVPIEIDWHADHQSLFTNELVESARRYK